MKRGDIIKASEIIKALEQSNPRSAWDKAVKEYALELMEEYGENHKDDDFAGSPADMKKLLNGAADWNQYSWGGCSLIYDADIAARVCSPSELKKTRGGERRPNSREDWLDTQARALFQAANRIKRIARA